MGVFNTDGSVELYFNNAKKFETTNTGAIITGVATATTFSGNLVGNVTGNVTGNADTATTATNAQGLTGTPDITVGTVTGTAFHTGAEGSAIRVTSSTIGPATLQLILVLLEKHWYCCYCW